MDCSHLLRGFLRRIRLPQRRAFLYSLYTRNLPKNTRVTMPPSPDDFWVLIAPAADFDGIPTISVEDHEVPLPAYWRIVDLWKEGHTEEEIIQLFLPHIGTKILNAATHFIKGVADNQKRMDDCSKMSKRLSVPFKKSKKPSVYRATRIEARRDLEVVEATLKTATQQEKKLLNEALLLTQSKEALQKKKMNADERRKTVSAIDQEMKHVLRRHQEVEMQINHAKRLTVIHKACLA